MVSQDLSRTPNFNTEWLDTLGYSSLDAPRKHAILRAAYNAFQEKVGRALAGNLPGELLDEFDSIMNYPRAEIADRLAAEFLQIHLPNSRDVISDLLGQLESELRQIRADYEGVRSTLPQNASSADPATEYSSEQLTPSTDFASERISSAPEDQTSGSKEQQEGSGL